MDNTNKLFSYDTIIRTIFDHGRPSYIRDKFLRKLTNLTHLFVLLMISYSNDDFLSYISLMYVLTDIPWHSIYSSEDIKPLKFIHSFLYYCLYYTYF